MAERRATFDDAYKGYTPVYHCLERRATVPTSTTTRRAISSARVSVQMTRTEIPFISIALE
jgi:hypothetical protein